MKRILAATLLAAVAFSLACAGKKKADTLTGEYFANKVEKTIEDSGPFDVETRLQRKGDAYNVKVDLVSVSRKDLDWNVISPEEKFSYFIKACAFAVGLHAIRAPEDLVFADLLISYEDEVWSLSVDFCSYIASANIKGTMTEEEIDTRLITERRQVK